MSVNFHHMQVLTQRLHGALEDFELFEITLLGALACAMLRRGAQPLECSETMVLEGTHHPYLTPLEQNVRSLLMEELERRNCPPARIQEITLAVAQFMQPFVQPFMHLEAHRARATA